jgi:hypothetical protein
VQRSEKLKISNACHPIFGWSGYAHFDAGRVTRVSDSAPDRHTVSTKQGFRHQSPMLHSLGSRPIDFIPLA